MPSDQNIPFNEKPAMQSAKITKLAIEALKSGKYQQVRINFPNPDMVGHTGDLDATIEACTTVDACVKVWSLEPLSPCAPKQNARASGRAASVKLGVSQITQSTLALMSYRKLILAVSTQRVPSMSFIGMKKASPLSFLSLHCRI